jgi:murein DD-endopeptidase MepM/ murein hydrolase activator NlpD
MPEDRWSVRNGVLIANPVEGDQILTAQAFEEFEVELEWRVAEGTEADVRVVPDGGISGDGYGLDRSGQSLRKFLLRTPIDGARTTSRFGMRRHPILGYTRMHQGVDFAAATGTPRRKPRASMPRT